MTAKIILINNFVNYKCLRALLSYKNIILHIINSIDDIKEVNLAKYDCIISPTYLVDIPEYSDTIFLYGPDMSFFPDKLPKTQQKNAYYNTVCQWMNNEWAKSHQSMNLIPIPYGIDTDEFNNIENAIKDIIFVYYKNRPIEELIVVQKMLRTQNIDYIVISGEFEEHEYKNILQYSKFGIWISSHETMGFELLQSLACDVPLFVWDIDCILNPVTKKKIPATSVPYWDKMCGEVFYSKEEIHKKFTGFIKNLRKYTPRKYVLDTMSYEKCESRLIDFINGAK
jgi:hypothetical protein